MVPIRGQAKRFCMESQSYSGAPLACAPSCPRLMAEKTDGCKLGRIHETFGASTGRWRGSNTDRLVALPWLAGSEFEMWWEQDGYVTLKRGDSCSSAQKQDNYLVTMDRGWELEFLPLNVSVDVFGSSGQAGVVLRTQSDMFDPHQLAMDGHYVAMLDWDEGRVKVHRRADGVLRTPLCNVQLSSTILNKDAWHTLSVLSNGTSIKAYLDGVLRCDVQDSASDALADGGAGLYTNSPSNPARFRNWRVEQIDSLCADGCDDFAEGEMCSFQCKAPFVPKGDATRTCGSTGSWGGSETNCGYPAPVMADQTREVLEESDENTAVGDPLEHTVPGQLEVHYKIISGNTGNAFRVSTCSGQLRVQTPSATDYEQGVRTITLTMEAATEGAADAVTTFAVTVTILDRNEPPVFAAQTRAVNENAP